MRARGLTPRALALAAALGAVASCTGSPDPSPRPERGAAPPAALPAEALGRFEDAVCDLPRDHLVRVWRGYHPGRSGEIQMIPREPHFVGANLSHSGPWEYVQRVPLFLYGPGHVPAAGRVGGSATAADLAPTLARHLRFGFDAPDGAPIEAAAPISGRPPKLILTLVWDSVGRNVLQEHPDAWPTLRALLPDGVWMEEAMVGSSPSVTPSVHTTLGTGAFPRSHGMVDMRFRAGGSVGGALYRGDRMLFLLPTLADRYGAARGNEPALGMLGTPLTLGILGHGSYLQGGGRPLAVDISRGGFRPVGGAVERYYRFPGFIVDLPGLDEAVRRLDLRDGVLDGRWLGEPVLERPEDVLTTPAFTEHQTRVVEEVIRREGFGAVPPTDLLFVNYRSADAVGHRWSMNSPQMEAVVRSLDSLLGRLVRFLDREVGEGEWVLALTADHGSTPHPDVSGATPIDSRRLRGAIDEAFGGGEPVVESFRVTQLWMRVDRLQANGHTLADVADHIAGYTKGDNAADPGEVPEGEREERLFAAAFPSIVLETAPCVPEG